MPKQINVKLGFEADTSQAKKQIQDLQNSLNKLLQNSASKSPFQEMDKDILKAEQSVAKLQTAINNSLNMDTGRLDLSKFSNQLGQADLSIDLLAKDLSALGADGQKAFLNLANSVITAQKPMHETNKLLDGMWTALKNTARWQLSSSILHGFMSSLQGAYGYAQDLNASLNSIRIVSGQSVEQMARFADQANRSAQALSTSTLAYTDAALIFYQQGLTGDAVTERVDTVLKLSNVTGDSAEQVSSYMTAIWNNFYDGSESLESFADKITALGAATASSSAEIASGLQQFAAIGNTVGLSYDYAATALATIVAQTRQSESSVGNGLRTVFARLSSLKQGGTDEDGTDLTKYTKALAEYGVQVKDQNGDLKQMDQILEEIGAKWQTLSQNQKVALAQTVGGVRQYATIMALFDNWDDFQRNLAVTQGAEGTLQEQADIYAESWEAARKRVQAAWQAIYQDLIDEKFFIGIANGIETILKGVDGLIDSIGGLKGVLTNAGAIITTVFGAQMVSGIQKAQQSLKIFTGVAAAESDAVAVQTKQAIENMAIEAPDTTQAVEVNALKDRLKLTWELRDVYDELSSGQQEYTQTLLKQVELYQQATIEAKKMQEAASEEYLSQARKTRNSFIGAENFDAFDQYTRGQGRNEKGQFVGTTQFEYDVNQVGQLTKGSKEYEEAYDRLLKKIYDVTNAQDKQKESIQAMVATRLEEIEASKKFEQASDAEQQKLSQVGTEIQKLKEQKKNGINVTEEQIAALEKEMSQLDKNSEAYKKYAAEIAKLKSSQNNGLLGANADKIVKGAQAVSQLTAGITSLTSIWGIWFDKANESIPVGEKLVKTLVAISAGLPMIIMGVKTLGISLTKAGVEGAVGLGVLKGGIDGVTVSILGMEVALGPLLLAIVGIAAVVGIIWGLSKAWNKAADDAKKAKEAAVEAKEEYQKLNSEFQELESSLNSLKDSQDALDHLREGTDEWKKAVQELNDQVMDLITKYPELAQYVQNINGSLRLSEEGMQAFLNQQYTEKQKAYAEVISTQKDSVQADLVDNATNLSRKFTFDDGEGNSFSMARAEDFIKVAEAYANGNDILGGTSEQINQALKDIGINSDLARQAIMSNTEEVLKMCREYANGVTSVNALSDAFYQSNIENEAGDKIRSNLGDDQAYLLSPIEEALANRAQEIAAQYEAEGKEAGEAFNLGVEEALNEYNEDPNSWASNAERQAKGEIAAGLGANAGVQIDEGEFDNFWNSLSSEEKQMLIEVGIDEEKSYEDIRATLDRLEEERDNSYQIDFKIDEDVDEEELNNLTNYIHDHADELDGFAEHLTHCKEEAAHLAHAILRFDDAIQDVTDNYEEWMDMLNSGAIQDNAKAAAELAEAYGDLLDIDGSALSGDFTENTENLELMKQAIEGNEEAYEKLQELAGKDILGQFGIDTSRFDEDKAWIESEMLRLTGQKWDDIEVGAELNDEAFLQKLTEMIQFCGDSVEQAEAYLQSLGIDAEVVKDTSVDTDEQETADFEAQLVPQQATVTVPAPSGNSADGFSMGSLTAPMEVYGVEYNPKPSKITTEKKTTATALRVKSAHKSAGGGVKYQHSNHGAGANGAGNTRGSGGGGGGSSKPKKKTVKEHKKPEKKEDRYHDIKERIEDLNTELKRLEKTESRVYGKAKLKYMDQEIEKLEKQIELTDEYIAEIKKYGAIDQANLRGINMGATFDENGRLNNYEQVLANIVADYNKAVATYNSEVDVFNASAQEDADNSRLEAADKAVNKAKELYDERLKILDQYEDTFNLLQQKMDERIDQVWELFDQRLEKITWLVEFELDWNEKELTHFDWILKYIGKDADHAADAIANLSQQMGVYEDSLNWAKKGIEEIFDLHNISFDFDNANPQALYDQLANFMNQQNLESQLTEKEAEALLSYMDAMRDAYDGMYDAWMDAHDHMMNAWDEWQERLQNGLNDIAQYGQELEGIQKIVELTGRKMLKMTTQDINRMNQALVVNSQEYLRAATARRDALEPEVLAAEKHLQELIAGGASEEAINLAQEEYRTMMEDWQDATNEWYDAFADALQAGQDAFEAFIEESTKDYKEGFGKMDLDYMQEQFDRQKKVRDLYLDDYQKYHELNKTAQELNKSLADTNNSVIRDKMLELQDDMNASMEAGVQISSAQAEIYARRVALLQAEAELLDAQNAKSAVRMTRDNEGNFSYTYTADQEQVGEAQNNYGDKFYELLDFERNYADQIQEEMLQSFQDFIDRRNEIAELYKDDQDAYNQAMEDLQEEYLAYMDYYVGELDMDLYEMQRLRDDDWLDFENITGLKLAEHDDFITFFGDTITGELTDSYNTAGELAKTWQGLMEESCQAANQAVSNYQINTETTYNKAGENIETYGNKVNSKFDEMANKSATTANTVEGMGQDMVNTMSGIQSAAYDLDNTWAYVMDDMRQQISTSISALQNLMQMLDQTTAKAQATIAAVAAAAQAAASMGYGDLGGYGSGGGSGSGGGAGSGSGGGSGGGAGPGGTNIWTVKNDAGDPVFTTTNKSEAQRWADSHNAAVTSQAGGAHGQDSMWWVSQGYRTGGYTGAWGSEGKLAVLHEKELVLNKDDTSNMLSMVNIVRGIVDTIGSNGMLNSLALAAGGATGLIGGLGAGLEQQVHIEANFPNVQSHTEIETALNNLINSASQYVNRKS